MRSVGGLGGQLNGTAKLMVPVELATPLWLDVTDTMPPTMVGPRRTIGSKRLRKAFASEVEVGVAFIRRKMGLDRRGDLARKYIRVAWIKGVGVAERRTTDGGWIGLLTVGVWEGRERCSVVVVIPVHPATDLLRYLGWLELVRVV
jgi:hypothetical protein